MTTEIISYCSTHAPKVTVIIPTYNRGDMLRRAIDSVLNQTYKDFELIIVSDGSTDETNKVVASYADLRIRFFKHDKSKGASAARNTGLQAAKGEYIAFLDDDDEWEKNKLELQMPVIEHSKPEVGLVYCWIKYVEGGRVTALSTPELRGDILYEMLDKQAITNSSALVIKREVLDVVHGFDEELPRGNDGDFIRRIAKYYHVDYVPKVLVKIYVGHEDRISLWNYHSRNRIFEYNKRLKLYAADFEKHPEKKLNVLSNMSLDYILMGSIRKGLYCFVNFVCYRCNFKYKINAFFKFTKHLVSAFLKS